ncbi:MAG: hypothetical protein K2O02_03590 [Lachnospiraceae bacterium]|nr:hypothetical protein [Lachnospiraceae bacterium]
MRIKQNLKTVWSKWNNTERYEDNRESYAYGLSRYKLMWLFIIGSVAGYILETVWYCCRRIFCCILY